VVEETAEGSGQPPANFLVPFTDLFLLSPPGGVGKTTLGLIAATSLRRHFGDCDSYFESLHGPISNFVSKHGWPPFRDCETQILKKLLEERPRGWVIACGGGVVDREENVEMLREFRDGGGVIVHVVRDKEEVVHYLIDEHRKYVPFSLFPLAPQRTTDLYP
jgi:shikimate kinase